MYLTEILARCSELEARMAKLYRKLAEAVEHSGDRARLWRELALEDETHADVLSRELNFLEQRGESGGSAPDFAVRLAEVGRRLEGLETHAGALSTRDEATALAIALEQVALEDLYDDLVLHGPPAFRLICERVEAALSARSAAQGTGKPRRKRDRTVSGTRHG